MLIWFNNVNNWKLESLFNLVWMWYYEIFIYIGIVIWLFYLIIGYNGWLDNVSFFFFVDGIVGS